MSEFTDQQKLDCIERELAMRRRVYPRWISRLKMEEAEARRQIAMMEAIAADYRERVQPGLFARPPAHERVDMSTWDKGDMDTWLGDK